MYCLFLTELILCMQGLTVTEEMAFGAPTNGLGALVSSLLFCYIPFHTEIRKFQNIQCMNHGGEVIIFTRLRC